MPDERSLKETVEELIAERFSGSWWKSEPRPTKKYPEVPDYGDTPEQIEERRKVLDEMSRRKKR